MISLPRPKGESSSSATISPRNARDSPSRIPARIIGSALGTTTREKSRNHDGLPGRGEVEADRDPCRPLPQREECCERRASQQHPLHLPPSCFSAASSGPVS